MLPGGKNVGYGVIKVGIKVVIGNCDLCGMLVGPGGIVKEGGLIIVGGKEGWDTTEGESVIAVG
jgi:hypothetical protein